MELDLHIDALVLPWPYQPCLLIISLLALVLLSYVDLRDMSSLPYVIRFAYTLVNCDIAFLDQI
jgi:hypothetical protein